MFELPTSCPPPGRGHQRGQPLQELARREEQGRRAIGPGTGQGMQQLAARGFSVLTEALDGDHGPRAAADHALPGGGAPEPPEDGIQPAAPYPRDHCREGTP